MNSPTIRTIVVSANGTIVETVAGKVFVVITATGAFTVQPDNETPLPMRQGRGFGDPASKEYRRLTFKDTSGNSNTVQFYAGDEPFKVVEPTEVSLAAGAEVSLAAGSEVGIAAADLDAITPAAVVHQAGLVQITSSVAYSAKKLLNVIVISGTVTVDCGTGAVTIPPGGSVNWSVFRMQDSISSVTVDASGGVAVIQSLA